MKKTTFRWAMLIAANAFLWGMLSLYQTPIAAQKPPKLPFANSVEQRGEMIRQLEQISALLKEQNALLRSGKLKVTIVEENDN